MCIFSLEITNWSTDNVQRFVNKSSSTQVIKNNPKLKIPPCWPTVFELKKKLSKTFQL